MRLWVLPMGALALLSPATTAAMMTCSVGSAMGVAFGSYDIFSGNPLDSTGSITYSCSDVEPTDSVIIQLGRGSSSTFLPRTLVHGAYQLDYNLYLDAGRSSTWGDGSSGTAQYGPVLPPEGTTTEVTIYGRIPAGQNAHAGSYSDTIVVTLVF